MTKILVSYGYGAGWSTWHSCELSGDQKAIAEYKPIIDFIEAGGNPNDLATPNIGVDKATEYHPLVKQMMADLDLDYFYTGGAKGLCVEEVDGPYRIDEYDGSESVTTAADFW